MSITQEPCECNTKNEFFSKEVFTANLRALRGKKSQNEMAQIVGLQHQQNWQRLETGAVEPNLTLLVRISKRFNVPVGVLLGVEEEPINMSFASDQSLLDGIRRFRTEMEISIARANTFLDSLTKIEKKICTAERNDQ